MAAVMLLLLTVAAGGDASARGLGVVNELSHAGVLHLVVDRSEASAVGHAVVHDLLSGVGLLRQRVDHLLILGLVDEDALDRDADLAGVVHRALEDLGRGVLDVHVRQHDRRVVAAELQRHLLERAGAGGHDLLARRGGAREGYVRHLRVLNDHLSQLVAAGQNCAAASRSDV